MSRERNRPDAPRQRREPRQRCTARSECDLTDSMRMFRLGSRRRPARARTAAARRLSGFTRATAPCCAHTARSCSCRVRGRRRRRGRDRRRVRRSTRRVARTASAWPTGNEFSDHKFEKHNYLNLAGSKLRTCALGPELAVDPDFGLVPGRVAIERAGRVIWEREIATGEREMCHSVANIEHHHFKFEAHRRPGDVHVHYYGAHSLSFADDVLLAEGDVMAIQFAGFGRALRNPVTIAPPLREPVARAVARVTAMKICRFLAGDAAVRIGLVDDDANVVDLTPAGITTLSQVLESADPVALLNGIDRKTLPRFAVSDVMLRPPIERQEVWAAGVTYLRSKTARMEESDFSATAYDRVYDADRPEIFFKALAEKVVPTGEAVGIRRDARWSVPEPELALVINSRGQHCRLHDRQRHELARHRRGEPLVSAAGEGLRPLVRARSMDSASASTEAEARDWTVRSTIIRGGERVFSGETRLGNIKRSFEELAGYLCRSQTFPHGAVLADRDGHRAARRLHPSRARCRRNRDRAHRRTSEFWSSLSNLWLSILFSSAESGVPRRPRRHSRQSIRRPASRCPTHIPSAGGKIATPRCRRRRTPRASFAARRPTRSRGF